MKIILTQDVENLGSLGDTIDVTKHMEDFYLIKIKPVSGLLVHGFAKAFVLHGEGLNEIKHLNDIGHKEK